MIYIELDKNSDKAMYLQISDQIRKKILSKELRYNDKLFSEKEFTYIYNVSEIVVKKAYDILRKEGLIRRAKGIGTFVTNRKITTLEFSDLFNISGFVEDRSFQTIFLTKEQIELSDYLIGVFGTTNEKIYKHNLIIYKDSLPFIYRSIFYKVKYEKLINDYLKTFSNVIVYLNKMGNMNLKTSIVYNTKIADSIIASMLLVNEKDPVASYKITLSNNDEVFLYVETEIPGNYLIINKAG